MQPEVMDKTIVCCECREKFVVTAEAQSLYLQRGLPPKPRLCPDCYAAYGKLFRVLRNYTRFGQFRQGRLI